ncbi:SigE family RNA polymerase sigma factor [Micromonospora krabiensis]|uniref:RNA polymerase sigma-70 factor, sigma-E family n=1 Tax=Micromonospora krabiensis TaxID=307121 RepID=A0A1C3N6G8_9ACTN|nr:SigE family RNA polymerase sigma factor [Micromonospora krabiensis]SBV28171.1 RNA polymerase sigma-70 factor, sigma-E family [Micromonospora krabiensis]
MGRDPLEEEFREFVAARSSALLRTAYLLAGDWATAEDLLQTALTKTYLAWKRLGGIEAIEPYARRVMVNTSTSWWRRRWHGERPTEVLPERPAADEIERQLDRDLLWRHLRALPARQRAILVFRFYEDMSEAQTAALLDISTGTVKSQTSRALATLRRRMGAEAALDLPAAPEPAPAPQRPSRRIRPAVPSQPPSGPAGTTPFEPTVTPTDPDATPDAAPTPAATPARRTPAPRTGTGTGGAGVGDLAVPANALLSVTEEDAPVPAAAFGAATDAGAREVSATGKQR